MLIEDRVGDYDVEILCEDPWKSCYLKVTLIPHNLVLEDSLFPNALALSANLVSTIMTGNAMDLLNKNNVPRTHPLWDLNQSTFWDRGVS